MKNNKLDGFPSVYCISLEESWERREEIKKQFFSYNIEPKFLLSKRFSETNDIVEGLYLHQMEDGAIGCVLSHLKALKEWYETTEEDYVFVCEDDLSLKTVEYWNFTWEEFIEKLPEDSECVQLQIIRDKFLDFDLHQRQWDDWGATAYIMTRNYTKKIIDTFIKDNYYQLIIPNMPLIPLVENVLFVSLGNSYSIPLFVENIEFSSTFSGNGVDVETCQKSNHVSSALVVLDYWKNINNPINKLEQLLNKFAYNTEDPEINFSLGNYYEFQNHTAPATTYYLRCAERTSNKELAYEALLRAAICYETQTERSGTYRTLLFQAQSLCLNRPEAYFLLSRYAEKNELWQECYLTAQIALENCDFSCKSLKTDVKYPGKYSLLFQKALAGWSWGKTEEAKTILKDLITNYAKQIPQNDFDIILQNLKKMNGE